MKIADLHCDLLCYLQGKPSRTANDPAVRASLPQMRQGGVVLQAFAIFTTTCPDSEQSGLGQLQKFKGLLKEHPQIFSQEITPLLAVENASSFCGEETPLEKGLQRLEKWQKEVGEIGYLSFTWNQENRFGGGNASKTGLKPDGLSLLHWMSGRKIAIDISHTSDALAYDIFNAIDKYKLQITPIASHSNFRKVVDHPRNLPDDIAKQIVERGGLIGLNFVRLLLGAPSSDYFLFHLEHAERLGVLKHLCFGADFFYDGDIPPELESFKPFFSEGFDNSSCYPKVINIFRKTLSKEILEKIAFRNVLKFFNKPII